MVSRAEKIEGVSEGLVKYAKSTHEFALKHHDIINQFGRFPHRNETLGREDTPEEVEYLKTAQRFG